MAKKTINESIERELTITRILEAPRELVFKAWTNPKQMAQWWGPRGFTNPVCELDVRSGGGIYIDMKGPDGIVYPMKGIFHEITEFDRLVFSCTPLDGKGNPLFEVLNTITFAAENGKTKLIMHASVSKVTAEAAPHLAGMDEGWNQTLDRLGEHVENL